MKLISSEFNHFNKDMMSDDTQPALHIVAAACERACATLRNPLYPNPTFPISCIHDPSTRRLTCNMTRCANKFAMNASRHQLFPHAPRRRSVMALPTMYASPIRPTGNCIYRYNAVWYSAACVLTTASKSLASSQVRGLRHRQRSYNINNVDIHVAFRNMCKCTARHHRINGTKDC